MKYITAVVALVVASLIYPGTPVPVQTAQAAVPNVAKLVGEVGSGFGGFIVAAVPCICADIGILITVAGPFGGDYLISFTSPPSIKLGAFTMIGGPVLGAASGGLTCGTRIHHGCKDKKGGTKVKYLAGIL